MKVTKLTRKAQDIVNQIMSADVVDIDHGRIEERLAYGNIHLTGEGLECNVNVDGTRGEMIISNESLNEATIVDGIVEIQARHIMHSEDSNMYFTLYKLSRIAAL